MGAIESPLMTIEEAAAYLRSSPDKVRAWISGGKLRSWRPDGRGRGRILYLHRSELERFLAAGMDEGPRPEAAASPPSVRGKAALAQAGWDGDDHRTRARPGRPKAKGKVKG